MVNQKWWQRTVAGVCATGLAVGLAVVGAATASAIVDANQFSVNEPDFNPWINGEKATQLLTIGVPGSSKVLDVQGNSTADGATVIIYDRGHEAGTTDVDQVNQSWEFVPDTSNSGGTIDTGWGSLRGRASGKCLDIWGGYGAGDDAQVGIWSCHGGVNQQWKAVQTVAGTQIISRMTTATSPANNLWLGSATLGGCSTNYNIAKVRTSSGAACTSWTISKASYRFATNAYEFQGGRSATSDGAVYRCLAGWSFKKMLHDADNPSHMWWGPAVDDSIGEIHNEFAGDLPTESVYSEFTDKSEGSATVKYQFYTSPTWQTGQVYVTCRS